jgi:hypothetical protein
MMEPDLVLHFRFDHDLSSFFLCKNVISASLCIVWKRWIQRSRSSCVKSNVMGRELWLLIYILLN